MVADVLLEAEGLRKHYRNGVLAVDDVSFTIRSGRTLGVVGESGCGKSTLAKLVLRLIETDAGRLTFEGQDLLSLQGAALRRARRRAQLVPQNPRSSLNPRLSVGASIEFNLRPDRLRGTERRARVLTLLEQVGLTAAYAQRRPHELSGGQLQRVAIARALAPRPSLIVCDEPTSALDKSVQAQVVNLLAELQREQGLSYLFISHDLAVVEHLADDVRVMYLGRVVESGPARVLWSDACHPYTRALLSTAPGYQGKRVLLYGDLPSPVSPPSGCTFRTRCPDAFDACAVDRPPLLDLGGDRATACLLHHPNVRLVASPEPTSSNSVRSAP